MLYHFWDALNSVMAEPLKPFLNMKKLIKQLMSSKAFTRSLFSDMYTLDNLDDVMFYSFRPYISVLKMALSL